MTTVLSLLSSQLFVLAFMAMIALKYPMTKKTKATLKWFLGASLLMGLINEIIVLYFYSEFVNLINWINK